MSKSILAQNQKLLHTLQCQIDFLKKFSLEQLNELATKAYFFVFTSGTVLAQDKQPIDFIAILLEGKVIVTGTNQKMGTGYFIGQLGYFGLIDKHVYTVSGDSDGIVLAIRLQDITKFSKQIKIIIHSYIKFKAISTLKNNQELDMSQPQQVQYSKISNKLPPVIKSLLVEQIEPKQRQQLLKYFPFIRYGCKSKVVDRTEESFLLIVVNGELIVKNVNNEGNKELVRIVGGQFYNIEGFLLNYSPNTSIYTLSQQSTVLKISRKLLQNQIDISLVQKIDNYLMRKQINDKKYQIMTVEKRKQKELQNFGKNSEKWSIFHKVNYQIIPLNIPKNIIHGNKNQQKGKNQTSNPSTLKQKQYQSTLFREQLKQQMKTIKTNSSVNSKLNKLISMKTQKTEDKANTIQQQLKDTQKQLQILSTKIKYYEQNYIKCKLDMIQFQAKYRMNAVFKELCEFGNKRYRNANSGATNKVLTLKKAFQEHMKENRIMEVVARCAYKWLWTVRKKKGLSKIKPTR